MGQRKQKSDALVTSSFLLLLVRHLLLVAMHLLLVASCFCFLSPLTHRGFRGVFTVIPTFGEVTQHS